MRYQTITAAFLIGIVSILGATRYATAAAHEKPITYLPPDDSNLSAAQLKNYYSWRQKMDWLLAPIHTRSDLERYLKEIKKKASPLEALPPDARQRFLSSLRFGSHGAGEFNTSDLRYL
jgi:hypothetical protein